MPNHVIPKISAPASRALEAIGVVFLESLKSYTRDEIKNLHGMGPNALGKIEAAMEAAGITFQA